MTSSEQPPFSIRVGARSLPVLQLDDMPESLRTALWNTIAPWYLAHATYSNEVERRLVWMFRFPATNWPVDETSNVNAASNRLKKWFFSRTESTWHEIYDFVEAIPHMVWYGLYTTNPEVLRRDNPQGFAYGVRLIDTYVSDLNRALTQQGAPYQYRDGRLLPFTNEHELAEISIALTQLPFADARKHIESAAQLLAARPEPDYRNSIKESISAVETVLWEITGQKGQKFEVLVKEFAKEHYADMHEALRLAIVKLYGWASDESGVRHGISGDVNVSLPDARLALVTCSAIVNFLAAKTTIPLGVDRQ